MNKRTVTILLCVIIVSLAGLTIIYLFKSQSYILLNKTVISEGCAGRDKVISVNEDASLLIKMLAEEIKDSNSPVNSIDVHCGDRKLTYNVDTQELSYGTDTEPNRWTAQHVNSADIKRVVKSNGSFKQFANYYFKGSKLN